MSEQMNGWIDRDDGWIDAMVVWWTNMDGYKDGWIKGLMDGWKVRWMDRWTDESMHRLIQIFIYSPKSQANKWLRTPRVESFSGLLPLFQPSSPQFHPCPSVLVFRPLVLQTSATPSFGIRPDFGPHSYKFLNLALGWMDGWMDEWMDECMDG